MFELLKPDLFLGVFQLWGE